MLQQPVQSFDHARAFAQRTKVRVGIAADRFSGRATGDSDVISLNFGLPDEGLFPIPDLMESVSRAVHVRRALQYGGATGTARLSGMVADKCSQLCKVPISSEEVLITSGSSQAFDLISRLFLDPGDDVWVEEPTYFGALHGFSLNGATLRGFPMDEEGLLVDAVEQELKAREATGGAMPKLFYVIPNYHNPTGLTMSLERRKQLGELAMKYKFYVLEDDAYGELGFGATTIQPIKSIAPEFTLYISTFSKTIAPGFRLGYVVAPRSIIQMLRFVKAEGGTSGFAQEVMANLLETLDYDQHLRTVRATYRARRDAMLEALAEDSSVNWTWTEPEGGFFVWVTLPDGYQTSALWDYALRESVSFVGGDAFYVSGKGGNRMRLSFSYYPPNIIREGIQRLRCAVHAYADTL
ncbi:MAG: PLP-dependent aminotransferase family protein [Alicyclobacillus macrosporangiidus]|uniref:aminotransferase-like domain-containing protein n=1 Tax=Alicyclobacillus macrosporangiidus TaxID=392015 RepID=UPI0026EC538D|nr:PLP-dependent aminotransferase family protein [Alicyclobacillus macrosporangiidus]MCL6600737.1 PLP-dependent aminotransferase family protein [Alicyclobacillus macrosporangiidus]